MEASVLGRAVDIARRLVRVKSLSGEEGEVAGVTRDLLGEAGVDRAFIDDYGSVIGVIRGGTGGSLVFEGHMDHVPEGDPGEWIYGPYEARVVNGRLYGRGVADMKGAIAAMIASASLIGETKSLPSIYYVFVPHEEVCEGAVFKHTMEETLGVRPSLVVLGEATNLNLYIGQRGRAVVYVDAHGSPAHASMPSLGINPIEYLAEVVRALAESSKSLPEHPLLGRSTATPTILECTPKSPPMIPGFCRLLIDRRFIPGETAESILSGIRLAVEVARRRAPIRRVEVRIPSEEITLWTGRRITVRHFFNAWITSSESTTRELLAVLRRVNPGATTGVWRFSTDGVYSAGEAGIPTIGIGPGDESMAHRVNEYVEVKQLAKAATAYAELSRSVIHIKSLAWGIKAVP